MTNGIGRALWDIYEDAVRTMSDEAEDGVSGATLKFIKAFEKELADAKIDLYSQSALGREINKLAKNCQVRSTQR